MLLSMLIDHAMEIRPIKQFLAIPLTPKSFHSPHKKLVLLAMHYINRTLPSLGTSPQATVLETNTNQSCEGGEGFVLGEKYIPFSSNLNNALDFLSDMYARELAYNTIASTKSVLLGIIHFPGVKGVFNTRPLDQHFRLFKDKSKLLNHLCTLKNDHIYSVVI